MKLRIINREYRDWRLSEREESILNIEHSVHRAYSTSSLLIVPRNMFEIASPRAIVAAATQSYATGSFNAAPLQAFVWPRFTTLKLPPTNCILDYSPLEEVFQSKIMKVELVRKINGQKYD